MVASAPAGRWAIRQLGSSQESGPGPAASSGEPAERPQEAGPLRKPPQLGARRGPPVQRGSVGTAAAGKAPCAPPSAGLAGSPGPARSTSLGLGFLWSPPLSEETSGTFYGPGCSPKPHGGTTALLPARAQPSVWDRHGDRCLARAPRRGPEVSPRMVRAADKTTESCYPPGRKSPVVSQGQQHP